MAIEYTEDQRAEEIKDNGPYFLWQFDLNKIELLQFQLIYQRDTQEDDGYKYNFVLTLNCEKPSPLYLFTIVLANCTYFPNRFLVGPRKISISFGRSIGRFACSSPSPWN